MSTHTASRRDLLSRAAVGTALCAGSRLFSQPAAARQDGLTPVSLQLNWNPNAEHAPYFLGRDLGFYSEVGIDVEILPGQGSAAAAQLVGTGSSQFGVAVADAVVIARSQEVPVVSTAVLLQDSPTVLISFAEKGIVAPTDLYGHRMGVNPQSTAYGFYVAFAEINELDRSQIEEVNISGSFLPLMVADQIDASTALLTNEVVTLIDEGFDLTIIDLAEYGVQSYGQVLFSNDTFLTEEPDLAQAFTAATLRSWEYTLSHVEEAIAALAAAVPETDTELEVAKWTPIRELAQGPAGDIPFGTQTLEKWTETYQTFLTGGLIENEFDPATVFSNDFQPVPVATPAP